MTSIQKNTFNILEITYNNKINKILNNPADLQNNLKKTGPIIHNKYIVNYNLFHKIICYALGNFKRIEGSFSKKNIYELKINKYYFYIIKNTKMENFSIYTEIIRKLLAY